MYIYGHIAILYIYIYTHIKAAAATQNLQGDMPCDTRRKANRPLESLMFYGLSFS